MTGRLRRAAVGACEQAALEGIAPSVPVSKLRLEGTAPSVPLLCGSDGAIASSSVSDTNFGSRSTLEIR